MACCASTTTNCGSSCTGRTGGRGFLLVIVLYILLAIIVGSFIC